MDGTPPFSMDVACRKPCPVANFPCVNMASSVWDFFTISDEDNSRAICTKCSANISRGGKKTSSFNTTNLISHLKKQHRYDGVLKAYEDASAAKEAANPKPAARKEPGLVPISAAFEKCRKFARDDPRAKAICDLIMEMMALDDQPFTIVEDKGFCRLVNHLEPRFVLPSRRYFSDACLQATEMLREKLHSMEGDRAGHDSPHPDDPPAKKSRADGNNSLLGMFDEILEENSDATAQQDNKRVDADLESYLSEPTLHLSRCPQEYWRSNQSRFKCLAQLARKYLSAPCTSVDSERLFSAAGHVMDERRNRLSCEKAEMLLFIKKNLPLIHPELTVE